MKQKNILFAALKYFPDSNFSQTVKLFTGYYQELLAWNQRINLISRKDEDQIVTRHFLESVGFLKAVNFTSQARVLDLGSGAGFPGIPIALVRPDLTMILVESIKKKAEFLRYIAQKLDLNNIQVINKRMEGIDDEITPVNVIVGRSVASLSKLFKWSHRCLKSSQGRLVTIKGEQYQKELHILLKQLTPDIKIQYRVELYDPFPDLYAIRKCYLVNIQVNKTN